jgi:hypothetical protein
VLIKGSRGMKMERYIDVWIFRYSAC